MSHVPFMAIDADANAADLSSLADSLTTRNDLLPPTSEPASSDAAALLSSSSISPADMKLANTARSTNRLPTWLAFPCATIISFGLSAGLYSFLPTIAGYELATVSRSLNEPWQIGALLAWKVAEIGIAWSAGLDYLDLLSLSILANIPYYVLLHVFYETSYLSLGLSFLTDTSSFALPFYLLRRVNTYNARPNTSRPNTISELAIDRSIQLYMSMFAAAMYSLIVYSSFYTWLPVYMILHFDEVRSLESAHNAALPVLFAACIPVGYAAKNFLFKPSIAVARTPSFVFDPKSATLRETVAYNFGFGASESRYSVLVRRTVLLAWFSFLNTFVRVFGTVEGTEAFGAAGWAALWSFAALAVGAGFAWIGES